MTYREIHPAIKEAIRHNSLIFFIGSGYSRNICLPTWLELVRRIVDELYHKDNSLAQIKEEAYQDNAEPLNILEALFKLGYEWDCKEILKNVIDIDLSQHDLTNQKKVWSISKKVITTNYDKALESALEEPIRKEVHVLVPNDMLTGVSILRDFSFLFKIHGCIRQPETCVLFSSDYNELYRHNHDFLMHLKRFCTNATLLFVGYSVSDVEIQYILKNIYSLFHESTKHFFLATNKRDFEKYSINTIVLDDYSDLIPYLDRLVAYREKIERNFTKITERIEQKYQGRTDLLSANGKDNAIFFNKEKYKQKEDRKDILQLEAIDYTDSERNQKLISEIIASGREESLKDYLLLIRRANKFDTMAYFEHVENRSNKSNLESAIKTYFKALKVAKQLFGEKSEATITIYNQIGQCYRHLNNDNKAKHYFKKGLRLLQDESINKSLRADFYNNLGNIEDSEGISEDSEERLHKALKYYQKALKSSDSDKIKESAGLNIGNVLIKLGKYNEAIGKYHQLLQNSQMPDLFKAHINQTIGLAYLKLKQFKEASTHYEQALSLFFDYYGKENKEFVYIFNDIGHCYAEGGDFTNAIHYYEKVILLEKDAQNIFIALNNLGEAYHNNGDFKEAIETFDKSLSILQKKQKQHDSTRLSRVL